MVDPGNPALQFIETGMFTHRQDEPHDQQRETGPGHARHASPIGSLAPQPSAEQQRNRAAVEAQLMCVLTDHPSTK